MELGTKESIGLRELFQGSARYTPVTAWGPFGALFVTLVACVASLGILFMAATVAMYLGASNDHVTQTAAAMGSLANPVGLGVVALSQLISLAIVWVAAGRRGLRRETLRLLPPKPDWASAIVAGLLIVLATGMLELMLYYGVGFDPFADSKWLLEGLRSPLWWGTVFVAIVLAPLWEEIAFRGFLLTALSKTRLGFWPAAVITSALWTALHAGYSYPGLASVFTAGLVLSWLMWRWGSLRGVVVAHSLANVAALLFTYNFAPAV